MVCILRDNRYDPLDFHLEIMEMILDTKKIWVAGQYTIALDIHLGWRE